MINATMFRTIMPSTLSIEGGLSGIILVLSHLQVSDTCEGCFGANSTLSLQFSHQGFGVHAITAINTMQSTGAPLNNDYVLVIAVNTVHSQEMSVEGVSNARLFKPNSGIDEDRDNFLCEEAACVYIVRFIWWRRRTTTVRL